MAHSTRTFPSVKHPLLLAIVLLLSALSGGCESAKATTTVAAGILPKPDMIVVRNFAVTPGEIRLDESVVASAVRESSGTKQSEEEVKVGHLVAEKLAQTLVDELNRVGIPAVRESVRPRVTATTAIIQGRFLSVDQGDQAKRVVVGFGLGASEMRTSVQILQGGKLVAAGETQTEAGLKPGMILSAGVGSAASIAVGAAGQGYSETFMTTVEADAARTATAVAKKIRAAYVDRGWLAE